MSSSGCEKHVVFERARFNQRNQLEGELAEQYIMELYRLADNCDYGAMRDEMIWDRLVFGIRDGQLSMLTARHRINTGLSQKDGSTARGCP